MSSVKYAIVYRCRNNSSLSREVVVRAIYELLDKRNPVNLKQPDWVILIEIIQRNCMLSVIGEYRMYEEFNLPQVYKREGTVVEDEGKALGSET